MGWDLEDKDVCMMEFGFIVGRACVRSTGRVSDGMFNVLKAFEVDGC